MGLADKAHPVVVEAVDIIDLALRSWKMVEKHRENKHLAQTCGLLASLALTEIDGLIDWARAIWEFVDSRQFSGGGWADFFKPETRHYAEDVREHLEQIMIHDGNLGMEPDPWDGNGIVAEFLFLGGPFSLRRTTSKSLTRGGQNDLPLGDYRPLHTALVTTRGR